jgi:hypothetical protein
MLERQGHLPGYTGHIPKSNENESFDPTPQKFYHIPNYQGFIPAAKSENLYGKTFSRITEMSALKEYIPGKDLPPEQRYKSVAQENFTPQLRIPVMPFKPKTYPSRPPSALESIPEKTVLNFFGSRAPGGKIYFGEEKKKEVRKNTEASQDNGLSYELARKRANEEMGIKIGN